MAIRMQMVAFALLTFGCGGLEAPADAGVGTTAACTWMSIQSGAPAKPFPRDCVFDHCEYEGGICAESIWCCPSPLPPCTPSRWGCVWYEEDAGGL